MQLDFQKIKELAAQSAICMQKHPQAELYIIGYYQIDDEDIVGWDDLTTLCRGIIIDGTGKVMTRPFEKFWTFKQYLSQDTIMLAERRVMRVPNCGFHLFEKLDGTMATLYWLGDEPRIATQRSFTSPKAIRATQILHDKYKAVFPRLNRDYTYVFEAIYPETKVLVDYGDREDLVLTGIMDTSTGETMPLEDIGFPLAKDFTPEYGHIQDFDELVALNIENLEGFILLFDNGERIKIKFPWFVEAHKNIAAIIAGSRQVAKNQMELIRELPGKTAKQLSRHCVWDSLQQGDDALILVHRYLTPIHYNLGVEFWLEEQRNYLKEQFGQLTQLNPDWTPEKIWQAIQPEGEVIFDTMTRLKEEINYDMVMWNWHSRFLTAF